MLIEVTANAGQKVGILIDLVSDTNYLTHRAANKLKLRSEKVTLVVHGVRGMAMKVNTRIHLLWVRHPEVQKEPMNLFAMGSMK